MRLLKQHIDALFCHNRHIYIGGSAARHLYLNNDEAPGDIDVFFRHINDAIDAMKMLELVGYERTFTCPKGELYEYKGPLGKFQLITKEFYPSKAALIDSFSLTVCQFAYSPYSEKFTVSAHAVKDATNKVLRIHKLRYMPANLIHAVKYIKKGYTPVDGFWGQLVSYIKHDWESADFLYKFD